MMMRAVSLLIGTAAAFQLSMSGARASPLQATIEKSDWVVVDEAHMMSESTFPIPPENLIERAKEVLQLGLGTRDEGECLAEDFEFVAAVVGPLKKEPYLKALKSFDLESAFNVTANFHLFQVDPFQPERVWFHSRSTAKHTGSLFGKPPTGKELTLPPQCLHIDFNADGKVKEFGFYVIDRRQGNTGGLGGAFGYFYGVGQPLPIPECKPYKRSFQFRFLNFVSSLGQRFSKKKE